MPEQNEEKTKQLPPDLILATMSQAVAPVVALSQDANAGKPFIAAVDTLVAGYMPAMPGPVPENDKCDGPRPDPVIKPLCSTLKLAVATANNAFLQAQNSAGGTLFVAVSGWDLAVSTYESALESAQATMDAAVKAAKVTYTTAIALRPDAISKSLELWYTLENTVVAAVTGYESSVASAAATLASSAATVLGEYATYAAAIEAAQGARVNSVSAANVTFWQGVQTGRDA